MKLIIAGTRTFLDYELLSKKLDLLLSQTPKPIEIVSGKAKGADTLGETYAIAKGYPVKSFQADWHRYGHAAGPIRNEEMAQYATHCVVFWDGKSKGTKSMIRLAKRYNLQLRIIHY